MRPRRAAAALAACAVLAGGALAQDERPAFRIGYLDLEDDVRYEDWGVHPVDIRSQANRGDRRPRAGAEMGIGDIRPFQRRAGVSFELVAERAADGAELAAAARRLAEEGAAFVLLDAPGDAVAMAAEATRGLDTVLVNVSSPDDSLRGERCAPHLLHTAPSRRMLTDAVAQHMRDRGWSEVLVLEGPLAEDAATVAAFRESAKTVGLDVEDVRAFLLSNDPRARDRNDIDLLSGRASYEAVFVADVDREFARAVPYMVRSPAPVAGAAGLRPLAWHWSYLRHGAPQVHGRFERQFGRRMAENDWSSWVAVRAIGEAVVRTGATEAAALLAYLVGPDFRLDGSKGPGLTFRPWNGQLRQPVFLASGEWVAQVAPVPGFEHRTDNLDTLGADGRAGACPTPPGGTER